MEGDGGSDLFSVFDDGPSTTKALSEGLPKPGGASTERSRYTTEQLEQPGS